VPYSVSTDMRRRIHWYEEEDTCIRTHLYYLATLVRVKIQGPVLP
jgi:hypothetical protein